MVGINIEMPKCCNTCRRYYREYSLGQVCMLNGEDIKWKDRHWDPLIKRSEVCPLFELEEDQSNISHKCGKWIVDEVNPMFARCSACNEGWDKVLTESFNYCPTCGTEMIRKSYK